MIQTDNENQDRKKVSKDKGAEEKIRKTEKQDKIKQIRPRKTHFPLNTYKYILTHSQVHPPSVSFCIVHEMQTG